MSSKTSTSHPTHSRSMIEEADIGSGERTPGQRETERIVKDIPPQGSSGNSGRDSGDEQGSAAEVERGAERASENDRAGHGQIQREQGRSRQDAEPGMTPDAPV